MLTHTVRRVGKLVRGIGLGRHAAEQLVRTAYRVVLFREPEPAGLADYTSAIHAGRLTPADFLLHLYASPEARNLRPATPALTPTLAALHASRLEMVRQLPRAEVIVDLGGGAAGIPYGALVHMGYPYPFRSLTIVEPRPEDRHELYKDVTPADGEPLDTGRGVVRYLSRSMADLSPIADGSVDLVFSGESIEHVSRDDCERVVAEAYRVLRPGGSFCFDTPNRALTRVHVGDGEFINPDHKYEYTHAEMAGLVVAAGFEVAEAKGLTWMPGTAATGAFDAGEMSRHVGMYDDLERCYLLYYRCLKPWN